MQERNNSDNEDTMLLPEDMDNYSTEYPANDLPPLRRNRPQSQQRYSGGGYEQYRDDRRDINGNPLSSSQQDYNRQFSRPNTQNYQSRPPQYQNGQQQYRQRPNNQQYRRPDGQRPYQDGQPYGNNQYRRPDAQRQNYNNGQYQQRPQQQANYHYYNDRPQQNYYSQSNQQPAYAPPPPSQQRRSNKKKKSKQHKSLVGKIIKRIFWTLVIICLTLFGAYSCTSLSLIGKVNKVPSSGHSHAVGALDASYVKSVLVLGTDNRGSEETGRSDSMILVSINTRTHEFVTTSIMRDCYVEIPGYGWNKLNAAYAFGGADLLMETIENNFRVRIDDYVGIDFLSFASIVDSVGGLDMEVSNEEAGEINIILQAELNDIMGDDRYADLLESGGFLHLNGKQALAYSRIRNVGNSDFERTGRQRKVIELMLNKVKTLKPTIFTNIATNVIPDVSTNMSTLEMYLYSLRMPFALSYDRKQIQVPYDGTFGAEDVWIGEDLMNVLTVDFDANYNRLQEDVFSSRRTVQQIEEPIPEENYGY